MQKQENLIFLIQLGVEKDIIDCIHRIEKEEPGYVGTPINKVQISSYSDCQFPE